MENGFTMENGIFQPPNQKYPAIYVVGKHVEKERNWKRFSLRAVDPPFTQIASYSLHKVFTTAAGQLLLKLP